MINLFRLITYSLIKNIVDIHSNLANIAKTKTKLMLYVQQFHHTRQSHLKEYERLRSAADHSFLLCSNQFIEKISRSSPTPPTRASTPNPGQRSRTLLILGRIQSLVALNNSNMTTDLSILNIVSSSIESKVTMLIMSVEFFFSFHVHM